MLECRDRNGLPFVYPLPKSLPGRDDPRQSMFSPWPTSMAVSSPIPTVPCHTPLVPNSLARSPHTWTKDEVRIWLEWCAAEFSIEPVSQDKFDMNGKALGLLTKEDFRERDPSSGDILYNALQMLVKKHDGASPCTYPTYTPIMTTPGINSLAHPSTPCPTLKSPVHLSDQRQNGIIFFSSTNNGTQSTFNNTEKIPTPYVPIRPVPVTSYQSSLTSAQDLNPKIAVPDSMLSPAPTTDTDSGAETPTLPEGDEEMAFCNDINSNHNRTQEVGLTARDFIPDLNMSHIKKSDGDCRLLWEFIHQLLQETRFRDFVSWERKEDLIFRIVNPTGLAELWGQQKNRTNMTYEKLSRALRYYYKMNIIKKVSGKRLTYQFLQHPRNIKKGQRGARPHSARLMKQESINVPSPHSITDHHQNEVVTPPTREADEQKPVLSHKPLTHPLSGQYDNYDRQPDLQLIGGRLQPPPEDSDTRFDSEEDHTVPYIKPEVPVQEEPEDLSMPLSRRRSSEVSDCGHVTEDHLSRSSSADSDHRHVKEGQFEGKRHIKMEISS